MCCGIRAQSCSTCMRCTAELPPAASCCVPPCSRSVALSSSVSSDHWHSAAYVFMARLGDALNLRAHVLLSSVQCVCMIGVLLTHSAHPQRPPCLNEHRAQRMRLKRSGRAIPSRARCLRLCLAHCATMQMPPARKPHQRRLTTPLLGVLVVDPGVGPLDLLDLLGGVVLPDVEAVPDVVWRLALLDLVRDLLAHELEEVLDVEEVGGEDGLEDDLVRLLLELLVEGVDDLVVGGGRLELGVLDEVLDDALDDGEGARLVGEGHHLIHIPRVLNHHVDDGRPRRDALRHLDMVLVVRLERDLGVLGRHCGCGG
mmetsp:Transcript_2310/g.5483  ORF Transcript_2310/g.5483 Transcript_2310/m.5483 type:complete len:313 (+) Transcript_2310:690-1628(+)